MRVKHALPPRTPPLTPPLLQVEQGTLTSSVRKTTVLDVMRRLLQPKNIMVG